MLGTGIETIYQHFPGETWLQLFTDGSKFEIDDVAGTGVYSEHFSNYLSLERTKTTFSHEVEAKKKIAPAHLHARISLSDQAVVF
ncbi:hypothetical protein TNIN_43991 [Trichonephila inaurata madagascariensis]|uniref:Uncharacterized protein n=1 Tax=Trichonephila inaurata madagascariensis TaxID=2747483 RepID=A0A8X6XUB3_9ARAC|nr:hypothetical protein TNIN_43991 [Trichonephila inaurata madagascariensis]